MERIETQLPGVAVFVPKVFGDARGFFMETYNRQRYAEFGLDMGFVQDNFSRSQRGVVRGLHYQYPRAQGKFVYVLSGAVLDVAVDIRRGSPTFGRWVTRELSAANHHQLWIPPGFAHGFCVLSETADFCYKCTDLYIPEDDRGITWNDPTVGVEWPLSDPLVSAKDRALPCLADIPLECLPTYA